MSLLTNYEGLRHQIEKLVRENEELKKLVRLIRENQELKSAIKMQAGALGISGFNSGLNETLTGPPQRQGSANESGADEVGVRELPSTADILNSPQLSPATLSMLLPSLGSMSQNNALASFLGSPLSSHLSNPLGVSVPSAIASALGLSSNGSLSLQSSSMTAPSVGTPTGSLVLPSTGSLGQPSTGSLVLPSTGSLVLPSTGSLGQPSTGSLGQPSTGSLGQPSTGSLGQPSTGSLGQPSTGSLVLPLTSSLGQPSTGSLTPSSPLVGPQFTSTTAPPGVSQSLLANPLANEAPRAGLAEPLPGPASGPHPSASAPGPAANSKVPLSTEHPLPTQDHESFNVTFVGGPVMTSTPVGAVGTPGSAIAFSFGSSEAQTQPGAPRGQAAAADLVPSPSAVCPNLPAAPDPAPTAATNHSPSNTAHICQGATQVNHSAPRPPPTSHIPPRTSSSPASVNGPPRGPDTARKSIVDLERKLAHRKTSKFPEAPREPKQLALERLVGEIAFQLDRRILSSIFPERVRLYGFTVSNIPEKIIQASLNPNDHKLDEELCQTLTQRYVSIMNRLQSLGYNGRVHPALTEQLVNAYGILRERPELAVSEGGSYTVDFLQRVLVETVHPSMLTDALLLLSCLSQLAHDDGKPMFIW